MRFGMVIIIELVLFVGLFIGPLSAQVIPASKWCLSECDLAGDEKQNTDLIHLQMKDQAIRNRMMDDGLVRFPLRIGIVQNQKDTVDSAELSVRKTINYLNEAFSGAMIEFYIAKVDVILSPMSIGDLSANAYDPYLKFSEAYDLSDTISVYLFNYDKKFCKEESGSILCGRTGGFSYILSRLTSNLVISKFDLEDHKVLAHEFGHFFGLYHTFERHQFGLEEVNRNNCQHTGDAICDTPADPGPVYEVYVNYSKCQMQGHRSASGEYYQPMINNYMGYYKPCYLQAYEFSPDQQAVLRLAALSALRKNFTR